MATAWTSATPACGGSWDSLEDSPPKPSGVRHQDGTMKQLHRIAWILILIVDAGYIAWGAGAAVSPDHLLGPGGKAILPAGYEGYSGGSWSELANASPLIAGYMTVLYRMYGVYNVLFGLLGSAIAVTAFRRGERWAWWALLIGNTVALGS